jgi:hypothetical protein
MIITNFVLYDKGSTPITGGVKKAIMELSNKWDSLLNSDEDLDYEYSDNDDSDRSSEFSVDCETENEFSYVQNFCDDRNNTQNQDQKSLRRVFTNFDKIKSEHHLKRRWKTNISHMLKVWRICSTDRIFKSEKFEKPEIEDSKIKCASTDIQSQVDSTFDISITVNNEFFTCPTSTLPSSADQTPFLFS